MVQTIGPSIARMLIVLAMAGPAAALAGAQERQVTVLALYSTRRGAPGASAVDARIERVLAERLAGRLDYYAEYMDLGRFPEPHHEEALRDFLRARYRSMRFDLVIATSNAVLDFVQRYRRDLFPDVPVVFSAGPGVPAPPNATGVVSGMSFRKTVEIALNLQPQTKQVFVISGASAFDRYYEDAAREQFEEFEGRLSFTDLVGLPIPELLTRIANLPPDSIVYFLSLTEDGAGHRHGAVDALRKLTEAASAPVYSWHSVAMGHGIVGGSLMSSEVIGDRIGTLALRVLEGEPAEAIAPEEFDPNVVEFDWRQLRRWQIDEAALPAHSTVRYRVLGPWEQYRVYIIAGGATLLLQTALIVALVVGRSRRKRIEGTLRQSQERYALATSAGAVGVWDWNLQSNDIYVDPELKRILGYDDDEIRNHLDDWGRHVHPDDADAVTEATGACLDGRSSDFEVEHRMLHKDGSVRWFVARGSVLRRPDGVPFRMVGTDTDITERKHVEIAIQENEAALRAYNAQVQTLAGRLITAQEEERARIARDLHDDVSQQLAALSIALSGLQRRLGILDPKSDLQASVASLQDRVVALAENIRDLSHDLHPSVLQHGGLVSALRAYCADVALMQGVTVTFRDDDDLPGLTREVALCLYRVTQEALRNIATHAQASRADVLLTRVPGGVELTIADDGQGFDIKWASRSQGGLGLLSITERVRLAQGTVSIMTELTRGTTVRVRIPFEAEGSNVHAGASLERGRSAV